MANRKRYLAEETEVLRDEEGQEQEEMEGCHERLYGLSMVPKKGDEKVHTFHPEINSNSLEIIGMMKEGDDYASTGRWEALYQYGKEKIELRNSLAKTLETMKENEALEDCTFQPTTVQYGNYQPEADVVTRTTTWGESLKAKKTQAVQDYVARHMEDDIHESTFKPRLIAEEKLEKRSK